MTKSNMLKNIQNIKIEYVMALILVGIGICKLLQHMSTERFASVDVSHGDIQFYGRDSCPFCVKMKKELKKDDVLYNKIEEIDIETDEGADKFKDVDASGVPHFTCKSTGKSTSGFQPIDKLLENLGLTN